MFKRFLSMICALTLLATTCLMLPSAAMAEEPYRVRMMIALPAASPSQQGIDKVVAAINEITLKELNMTLTLEIMPFSQYLEQVPLELSAGSDLDIFTGVTGYSSSWWNSGYLLDMSDLLKEYGKDIPGTYSSDAVATAVQLDGKIYGMPVHKEIAQQPTIFFRTDILEKHGIDVSGIKTIADVDALYAKVAELEPNMWMLAADNTGMAKSVVQDSLGTTIGAALLNPADNTTVTNLYASDEFKEWCTYNHKWYNNGWINSGAASDTESYYAYITSGQAFSFFSDYGHPMSEADQEANCGGVDLTMVTLGKPYATTATTAVFFYCIASGSKDPVKAMQMLNFIETSKEMMNLLNWGVEGDDYVVNADGLLEYPEGKGYDTVDYHLGAGWILPNQFVCTPWSTDGSDIYDKVAAYNDTAIVSKAMGFAFNPAPVMDEVSALTNVRSKYYKALIVGAVDPEAFIPKFLEELEGAGMQTVLDEVQKQLDEFLAKQ